MPPNPGPCCPAAWVPSCHRKTPRRWSRSLTPTVMAKSTTVNSCACVARSAPRTRSHCEAQQPTHLPFNLTAKRPATMRGPVHKLRLLLALALSLSLFLSHSLSLSLSLSHIHPSPDMSFFFGTRTHAHMLGPLYLSFCLRFSLDTFSLYIIQKNGRNTSNHFGCGPACASRACCVERQLSCLFAHRFYSSVTT